MLEFEVEWDNLDQAFAELEAECTEIIRGITVELWNSILWRTPQFYGRMAASWTYSLQTPVFVDRSKAIEYDIRNLHSKFIEVDPTTGEDGFYGRRRGDPEAIQIANLASYGHDSLFKLGMTVWIANGVDHGEGPYSQELEMGNVKLRPENRPGAPVSKSLDQIEVKYGNDINPGKTEQLKTLRIT